MYNTIYPNAYIKPYQGVNNRIVKRKEDEEQSQSSNQPRENQKVPNNYSRNQFPNGEQVAIDYSKSTINIAQILADFHNTTSAIGAPDEVTNEVHSYLKLIETQAEKPNPNKQIIKSNLKNASQVLDGYITEALSTTESLNKPSKVVENWIDTLFLQNVIYKADPTDINPEFRVQLPEKKAQEIEEIISDDSSEFVTGAAAEIVAEEPLIETQAESKNSGIYVPEDKQLRRMFVQAKKYAAIDNPEKALNSFKQTLDYAKKVDDSQAQSIIYYEVAKIYDNNDCLPEAIKSYNKAIEKTEDNNIKARSHIAMGQIYDDVVQFEPAVDHYFAGISFAGESENLNAQTKALTNLANLYCNRYDKKNTSEYINLATDMAKETKNDKVIASVYGKAADMNERLEENPKALQYYKESTKYYSKAELDENVVQNYQSASDIMIKLGDKTKAKTLLQKAYIKGQSIDNPTLLSEIAKKLTQI